jgi:hypothetical protein
MRSDTTHFLATTLVLIANLLLGPLASVGSAVGAALALTWIWATYAAVIWGDSSRHEKVAARWLALGALLLDLASLWRAHLVLHSAQVALGVALLVLAVLALFRHLLRARRVTTEQILASITLMMLLGMVFTVIYGFLDRLPLEPAAFRGLTETARRGLSSPRAAELQYFSFVTLTTLGYGDVTPLHPLTRSVAAIEALTGQLYIAVLVARLVAMHLMTSQPRGEA